MDITGKDIATIQTEIYTALTGATSGDIVTVTGTVTGAATSLSFTISTGKTVVWQADYSGSQNVIINGSGTFEIKNNGKITSSVGGSALYSGSASIIVGSGGIVEHVLTYSAIEVEGNASLTVDGGTVSSQNYYTIYAQGSGGASVIIKDGTVKNASSSYSTIRIRDSAALAITGGTVQNTDTSENAVRIAGDSTVFVSGSPAIAAGGIQRDSGAASAAGYYTSAANTAAFRTSGGDIFTADTDLFRLDGVSLSTADGSYSYDGDTPATKNVVATLLSDKLDLTGATVTASAGNPTVDKTAKTVTFGTAINNDTITITVSGAKITGTNIPVSFTTVPFGVNIATPSEDDGDGSDGVGDVNDGDGSGGSGANGGGCNTGAYGLSAMFFSLASPKLKKRVCRALRK